MTSKFKRLILRVRKIWFNSKTSMSLRKRDLNKGPNKRKKRTKSVLTRWSKSMSKSSQSKLLTLKKSFKWLKMRKENKKCIYKMLSINLTMKIALTNNKLRLSKSTCKRQKRAWTTFKTWKNKLSKAYKKSSTKREKTC